MIMVNRAFLFFLLPLASALLFACGNAPQSKTDDSAHADSVVSSSNTLYAEFSFNETQHHFGTFSRTDSPQVSTTFSFTNVGQAPLVINSVSASCRCTHVTYTHRPVEPGDTGSVTVTYNGVGMAPGHFRKSVTLYVNTKRGKYSLAVDGIMEK